MGMQEDLTAADMQMQAIQAAIAKAVQIYAAQRQQCANAPSGHELSPQVAAGWRKWSQDVNSFLQGKIAEVGEHSRVSTSVLAASVQNDPDRRTVFAPQVGLPPINQEYKVVSAPTRTQASAVQGMIKDAVGQLNVPGRSSPGDTQQAVIQVLNHTNPWPCSRQTQVKEIEEAAQDAAQKAHFGGQQAAYNSVRLQMLERYAEQNRPNDIPAGGSVIVQSTYWNTFFRITPGKVLCSLHGNFL